MGRAWLNCATEEHGMFWWGDFGRSAEHTAWMNLRAGIPAPRSGPIAQNGAAVAEQIGEQIFVDAWGWVHPGDPARAAATAASVAHDGNGLEGARFVGAVAAAFTAASLREAFEAAVATLDPAGAYAAVARAVEMFHVKHPGDWWARREMLGAEWGYDRYPGVCHVVPNAGVLVMALLYGDGDLNRTVEVATMAGWDADCNAGAVAGTLQGVQPSWDKYRPLIDDLLIASGVSGTLNVADVPSFARELSLLALRLRGEPLPSPWQEDWERKGLRLDFALPGSTHGFRAWAPNGPQITLKGSAGGRMGSWKSFSTAWSATSWGGCFGSPSSAAPTSRTSATASCSPPSWPTGSACRSGSASIPGKGTATSAWPPYVRRSVSGALEEAGSWLVPLFRWSEVAFAISDGVGDPVDEVGLCVEYFGRVKFLGRLFLADFRVDGPGRRVLGPARLVEEWGPILQCSWNRGRWTLEEGAV